MAASGAMVVTAYGKVFCICCFLCLSHHLSCAASFVPSYVLEVGVSSTLFIFDVKSIKICDYSNLLEVSQNLFGITKASDTCLGRSGKTFLSECAHLEWFHFLQAS